MLDRDRNAVVVVAVVAVVAARMVQIGDDIVGTD
jgi:hypothetical protein